MNFRFLTPEDSRTGPDPVRRSGAVRGKSIAKSRRTSIDGDGDGRHGGVPGSRAGGSRGSAAGRNRCGGRKRHRLVTGNLSGALPSAKSDVARTSATATFEVRFRVMLRPANVSCGIATFDARQGTVRTCGPAPKPRIGSPIKRAEALNMRSESAVLNDRCWIKMDLRCPIGGLPGSSHGPYRTYGSYCTLRQWKITQILSGKFRRIRAIYQT